MGESMKLKLMGWSATVGLTALAMLGQGNSAQAAYPTNGTDASNGKAAIANPLAAQRTAQTADHRNDFSSPPPPPPPPAIGGVRG